MVSVQKTKLRFQELQNDQVFQNDIRRAKKNVKKLIFAIFRFCVIIGVSYVILSPLIEIISNSFFSDSDATNPMVYVIPNEPTLEKYIAAWKVLPLPATLLKSLGNDLALMAIQIMVCSMVGYGFARFDFPCKNLLFACVVIMIVIPTHAIMLPLYLTFTKINIFGLSLNLYNSMWPFYLLTILGCGLRSGLYIYIFNQFFRGLPKEIEEAAFVDGAGSFYTYFRIMLLNAIPSVITVAVFSMVWQYNDLFYSKLFGISEAVSMRISALTNEVGSIYTINSPALLTLYLYAGIVLIMIPIIVLYCVLQKFFIEGVERSGIVG